MTLSDDWAADKAYQQRGSDGANAWGLHGEVEQTQAPPMITEVHSPLPADTIRLPDQGAHSPYRGYAIRMVHTYFDGSDYLS